MRKIKLLTLLSLFVFSQAWADPTAVITAMPSGAAGGMSGGSYSNSAVSVAQSAIGTVTGGNYIMQLGIMGMFASGSVAPSGVRFSAPVPKPSEVQTSMPVTIGITVTIDSGDVLNAVRYRVTSVVGDDGQPDFSGSTYKNVSFSGTGTSVTVTASESAFELDSNNWVQWYANTTGGANNISNAFRVQISTEQTGEVKFVSPAVNTQNPNAPAAMLGGRIDATLTLEDASEANPANVTVDVYAGAYPGDTALPTTPMYTRTGTQVHMQDNTIAYIYDGTGLEQLTLGSTYTLVIDHADPLKPINNLTGRVVFTYQSDAAISELIPFPSPFDPKKGNMKIRYVLAKDSSVTINIYNRAGKLVRVLVDGKRRPAGRNEEEFNGKSYAGSGLANGIYICEIKVGGGKDRKYTSFGLLSK
jgi:hypothetical protein